jgi:hypothetical protein
MDFRGRGGKAETLWAQYRERVLTDWLEAKPGKRPHLWWEHDAPKQKAVCQGKESGIEIPVPRKRLGGAGTPAHEVFAFWPSYRYGIPATWACQPMIDHGVKKYGGFWGDEIDEDDPPRYESEADYLKFHGLFLEGEEQRLTEDQFVPEALAKRHSLFGSLGTQSSNGS